MSRTAVLTIHLNGSSAEALITTHEQAGHSLRKALEDLSDTAPNARDFYVQKDGAFEQARAEHEARVSRVRGVLREVEAIHENLVEQQAFRERR